MADRQETTTPTGEAVWDAVLSARESLAEVVGGCLSRLSDEDVDGLLPAAEETARMLAVLQHALAGEVGSRGMDVARGYKSTANYLRDALRITRREASHRLLAAERLARAPPSRANRCRPGTRRSRPR